MKIDEVVIDFETEESKARPDYPPRPVGVSIKMPGKKAKYYAWGHPVENNCTFEEAQSVLRGIWRSGAALVFHNAKFDLAVANEKMGLPIPSWDRIHCTMIQCFLHDPYLPTFALKPVSELLLGMKPSERDAVRDWLVDHQPVSGTRVTASNWGRFIAYAPGALVGRYADGDAIRTDKLHKKLMKDIRSRGMMDAYEREMRLMPILMANEQHGIRVDTNALVTGVDEFSLAIEKADAWIGKRLGVPGLNLNADAKFAEALLSAGVVTDFVLTPKGKPSVSKENLTLDMFSDPRVFHVLNYRNKLSTIVGTFMRPWLEMATVGGGRIFTRWSQVRGSGGGAVTGRLASSPNFQNMAKEMEGKKGDAYTHPSFLRSLPHLPALRRLILPDAKQILLDRDFSQQEVRIAAHFEDGPLLERFRENPNFDLHDFVEDILVSQFGIDIGRGAVKTINFGLFYGMGATGVGKKLGMGVNEARSLVKAQKSALPGVIELDATLKEMGRTGVPMRTWGGREYYCEEPMIHKTGGIQTFEYKMLNYLIQGSAADCTKQAIINYDTVRKDGTLLLNVHDELLVSAPNGAAKSELRLMRDAMADVAFDVPMLSSGKTGPNFGEMKTVKESK